jgi:putative membrane protein
MRLIYWLIAGPLIILAVLFALSNRDLVDLEIWPLPFSLPAPVYLVALGGLAVGFFAGGIVAWFGAGRTRARARAAERALRARDVELEDLRRKVKEAEVAEARQKAASSTQPSREGALPAPPRKAAV